jgi:predicted ArsR family transcriptional regulator
VGERDDVVDGRDLEQLGAVAVLADGQRRALYDFVCRQREPVTREEAAAAVGISRKLAAFHLDKLIAAGLLRRGRRQDGQGPRRPGRAPKLYEPSDVEVHVTIPERRYQVAAEILLDAVSADGEPSRPAVIHAAREHGTQLGRRTRLASRPVLEPLLKAAGYEPARRAPDCVELANCPFHQLAQRNRELVCTMNHAYLEGVLEGLEAPSVRAVLSPDPPNCCVELRGVAHPDVEEP